MVKKDWKWEWTERQKKMFKKLKERFTKELVLATLNLDKKNENRSGCVELCYRRDVIYKV